jgi:hypothetical protein
MDACPNPIQPNWGTLTPGENPGNQAAMVLQLKVKMVNFIGKNMFPENIILGSYMHLISRSISFISTVVLKSSFKNRDGCLIIV